jgi:hypothetical protein
MEEEKRAAASRIAEQRHSSTNKAFAKGQRQSPRPEQRTEGSAFVIETRLARRYGDIHLAASKRRFHQPSSTQALNSRGSPRGCLAWACLVPAATTRRYAPPRRMHAPAPPTVAPHFCPRDLSCTRHSPAVAPNLLRKCAAGAGRGCGRAASGSGSGWSPWWVLLGCWQRPGRGPTSW